MIGTGSVAVTASPSGFTGTWPMLRARGRMLRNALWHPDTGRRGWTIILTVLGVGGFLALHRAVADALAASPPAVTDLVGPIDRGLGLLFGFTAVTGVTFTLASLYFGRDIETLLTTPVRPRSIVLAAIAGQLTLGVAVGAFLAGGPLVAYASATGSSVEVLLAGVTVLGMCSVALSAATLLTILGLRLLPARRVRDLGGLLVLVIVFAVAATNVALRGGNVGSTPFTGGGGDGGGGLAGVGVLPTGWAARAIDHLLRHDLGGSLPWVAVCVLAGLAAPVAVAGAAEAAYVIGHGRNLEAGSRPARRHRSRRGEARRHPVVAMALKDLTVLRRDSGQLGQLLIPMALFTFYVAAPSAPATNTAAPAWFSPALTASFGALFATSGVALRGVGLEGRAFWAVRVAPVGVRQLVASKVLLGWVVAAPLGLGLLWVGGLHQGLSPGSLAFPSALVLLAVSGQVCIAVGIGACRPLLDWTDSRRSVGFGTSLVFLMLGSSYVAAMVALTLVPFAVTGASVTVWALCDGAAVALTVAAAASALGIGAHLLELRES